MRSWTQSGKGHTLHRRGEGIRDRLRVSGSFTCGDRRTTMPFAWKRRRRTTAWRSSPRTVKQTNHSGGTLGGMSDGSPIVFRAAFKPTPSIARPQQTVDRFGKEREIVIKGRHDPIIVPPGCGSGGGDGGAYRRGYAAAFHDLPAGSDSGIFWWGSGGMKLIRNIQNNAFYFSRKDNRKGDTKQ